MTENNNAPKPKPAAEEERGARTAMTTVERRTTFDLPDVNLVQNSPFMSSHAFAHAHRMATVLANTSMVPDAYRQTVWDKERGIWVDNPNAVGNCMIAIDLSNRLGTGVLEVMQNVDVIYGRPAMRAILSTALVNKFAGPGKPYQHELRYESNGETGDAYGVRAYTVVADGTRLVGPWITWKLVKAEGWHQRKGNKWQTIPEKMFAKRAASWWADLHAPHITLGLMDPDEVEDAFPEGEKVTRAQLLESKLSGAEERVITTTEAGRQAIVGDETPQQQANNPEAPDPKKEAKPRGTRRKVKPEPASEEPAGEAQPGTGATAEVGPEPAQEPAVAEEPPPPQTARPSLNLE